MAFVSNPRKADLRFQCDPNGKRWASDTTSFGYQALQAMGWTPGTSLGAAPERAVATTTEDMLRKAHRKKRLRPEFERAGLGMTQGKQTDDHSERSRAFIAVLDKLNAMSRGDKESAELDENLDRRDGARPEQNEPELESMSGGIRKAVDASTQRGKKKRREKVTRAPKPVELRESGRIHTVTASSARSQSGRQVSAESGTVEQGARQKKRKLKPKASGKEEAVDPGDHLSRSSPEAGEKPSEKEASGIKSYNNTESIQTVPGTESCGGPKITPRSRLKLKYVRNKCRKFTPEDMRMILGA